MISCFCLSYRFPGALTHSWHFFDPPTLFLYFLFLDQIRTILLMMVDDKGRPDSRWEVRHHVVGDYNFLTQKKNIFLKITSCPPPLFAPCCESNNVHMDMCNLHMIILILRKTLFFDHDNRPWQLARDARPRVIGTDKS
jgi:hypothetical protein